jgi:hypothetical protein
MGNLIANHYKWIDHLSRSTSEWSGSNHYGGVPHSFSNDLIEQNLIEKSGDLYKLTEKGKEVHKNKLENIKLIEELHKLSKSHKEKAILEETLRNEYGVPDIEMYVFLDTGYKDVRFRKSLKLIDIESIWDFLDKKRFSLGTVFSLLEEAKKRITEEKSLEIVFQEVFDEKIKNGLIKECVSHARGSYEEVTYVIMKHMKKEEPISSNRARINARKRREKKQNDLKLNIKQSKIEEIKIEEIKIESSNLDDLINEWKSSKTEFEKAKIEDKIWRKRVEFKINSHKEGMARSLASVLNISAFGIRNRQFLFLSGEDVSELWKKVDKENYPVSIAKNILKKAKEKSDINSSLSEIIKIEINNYEKIGFLSKTKEGKYFRKNIGVNSKVREVETDREVPNEWNSFKATMIEFIKNETAEVDEILKYGIISEFIIDIEILIRDYGSKINKAKAKTPLVKNIRKSEIEEACSIIGVKSPYNMDEVKKNFRKLAKDSHPDIHGPDMEWKFKEVVSAYRLIEEYVQQNGQK